MYYNQLYFRFYEVLFLVVIFVLQSLNLIHEKVHEPCSSSMKSEIFN